jgi:prepilin signal peptidase PulO-like enzyme (type II secretory pathway)
VVELLTAVLFATLVWRHGADWLVLAQMAFVSAMVALIFIDAQRQLLPDVINYPLYLGALALAPARTGWGAALSEQMHARLSLLGPESDFVIWQAALCGGLILALAVPSFWLLDWLDAVLFDRYFEEEVEEEKPAEAELGAPDAQLAEKELDWPREFKRRRVILGTALFGLGLTVVWVLLVFRNAPAHSFVYQRAYSGLLYAFLSAVGAAGTVWVLRALYFVLRRMEGMGLGDVKMMAVLGAFLGWYTAFGVLLYSSILGAVAGVIVARYSRTGLNTTFPFGVFLGAMAILAVLI